MAVPPRRATKPQRAAPVERDSEAGVAPERSRTGIHCDGKSSIPKESNGVRERTNA